MDIKQFLEPIKGENPCGVDLRIVDPSHAGATKYFALKEARNNQRRQERRNVEIEHTLEISAKEWLIVAELAQDLLLNYTKDLEVASWFLEALVRTEKFAGLCKGLRIFTGLVRNYSSHLHPAVEDEEEQDIRLSSIGMLGGRHEIGTVVVALYYHTLLPTISGDNLNAWNIRQIIERNDGNPDDVRSESLMEKNEIRAAILQLEKDTFSSIALELNAARHLFTEFNSALSAAFSASAPDLSGLRNTLQYCCNIAESVKGILDNRPASQAEKKLTARDASEAVSMDTSSQLDKESAIRMLETLSQFFLEANKHSPISYSLARIARWARAELPDVLLETMDSTSREMYCKITGVPFAQGTPHGRAQRVSHQEDDY